VHPVRGVVDGLCLTVLPDEQRNHRWSTELSEVASLGDGAGGFVAAFVWQTLEPMRSWRIAQEPTASGVAFDLTWTARTAPWTGTVEVDNPGGTPTAFDHLFQSGTYDGWIEIDGERITVDGWVGARDRSRGVRTMRGGQGLHLWVLGHFADATIGAMLVEDRKGGRILVEGGVLAADGTGAVDQIVDVRHDLAFDELLDLDHARLVVTTESGAAYSIDANTSARGGYMAGGGYGDHHGERHGRGHVEDDVYPLDGTVGPRTLDSALTDRTTLFTRRGGPGGVDGDGEPVHGVGIFEFARTRSASYDYRPTT
jgi:hypothetical protein